MTPPSRLGIAGGRTGCDGCLHAGSEFVGTSTEGRDFRVPRTRVDRVLHAAAAASSVRGLVALDHDEPTM
jgi:hypothetical protein